MLYDLKKAKKNLPYGRTCDLTTIRINGYCYSEN